MSVPPVTLGSIPGPVAALCVEPTCERVFDCRVKACPACGSTVYLLVLPTLDRRKVAA